MEPERAPKGRMLEFLLRLVCCVTVVSVFAFFTSGCYDSREMEETGFILAAGFEPAEGIKDGVRLTVQVAVPAKMAGEGVGAGGGAGGGGEAPVWNASASASSVVEAEAKIQRRSATDLFWAHSYAALISEDLARRGIENVVGFLTMEPEVRPITRVFVVKGDMSKLLEVQSPQQPVSASYIDSLARWETREGMFPEVRLHELAVMLSNRGQQAYVPVIGLYEPDGGKDKRPDQGGAGGAGEGEGRDEEPSRMDQTAREKERPFAKEGEEGKGQGQGGRAGAGGGEQEEKPQELEADGIAVFRGDRMVGILDDDESRGLAWLIGHGNGSQIAVEHGHLKGEVVLRTLWASVDKKVIGRNESPEKCHFLVTATVEAVIAELNTSEKFTDRKSIAELEKHAALKVEREMRAAISAAQEKYGSDFIGFGEVFRRSVPVRRWEEIGPRWEEIFPRMKVETMVTVKIRRRGMTLFRVEPAD